MAEAVNMPGPSSSSGNNGAASSLPPTKSVFLFKVEYKHGKPKVWRKIEVPGSYTFRDLHKAILDSLPFGRCGCGHLHSFTMLTGKMSRKERNKELKCLSEQGDQQGMMQFLINSTDDDKEVKDSEKITNHFKNQGDKANYLYDFGDAWEYIITLENILPPAENVEYPRIVGGRCKCVPDHPGNLNQEEWAEFEKNQKIFNYKTITFPRARKVVLLKK